MFCPKCGTKNIDEAKFCGACGTPLDANAYTPTPQVARVQPSAAPGGKNALPLLIAGAAAGFIVVVLIAVFVVVPAFNKNPFKGAQVGDVVEFGSYEQDGNVSNGKEPIEWRVLAVEGNRAYVVSEKGLDAHAFNEDASDGNDWSSSDLKKWLEGDFATAAFTSDEMEGISGSPTLLSVDEADEYFKSDADRICKPTQQAVNNGAWKSNESEVCAWWLRSPGAYSYKPTSGIYSYYAAYIYPDGRVFSDGCPADNSNLSVRPALWVNL